MKLLIFSILFVAFGPCFAQKPAPLSLRFEHLDEKDGLSNSSIRSIYRDRDGYFWFGTEDGLNRYDGTSFKIYRHDSKDSNSIAGNDIISIADDRQGGIWVDAHCRGFADLNVYSGKATPVKEQRGNPETLQTACDVSVVYDDAGNTWIKNSEFLSRYDPATKKFSTAYRVPANEHSIIFGMLCNKGTIWLGQDKKLKAYHTKENTITDYSSLAPGAIACSPLMIMDNGDLFVGSYGTGLYILNASTGKKNHLLGNTIVSSVKEVILNGRRQIWVATSGGLWVADLPADLYSLTDQSFTVYLPNPSDPYSLSSALITSILQDSNGIIWLGTANGIDKLNPAYLRFEKTELLPGADKSFEIRYDPSGMFVDYEKNGKTNYWFNYWNGGGLVKTDEAFDVLKHIRFKHWREPFPANGNVSNVFKGRKGNLWIVTWDGLWEYDPINDQLLRNFKPGDHDSTEPKLPAFDYGAEDDEGNIWIGTYNQYLHMLNPATGQWKKFPDGPGKLQPRANRSDFLFFDSKRRMWSSDISYYDLNKQEFIQPAFEGLAAGIIEDRQHRVWIGTEYGIGRYNEQDNNFTMYGVKEGLAGANVQAIITDADDNIWANTLNGLSVLNTKTNIIRTFTVSDGLPVNRLGAVLQLLPDGKILINYNANDKRGFLRFDPRQLLAEKINIPFHFTSFSVSGRELNLDHSPDSMPSLDLDYRESLLTIGFDALAFADNINVRYRYRLNNADNKWTDLGKENTITFTGLRGGSYDLAVEATDGNGNWMKKSLNLKIIVHPPFWRTWWFVTLVALFTGLIITYFVWRRIRNIKTAAAIKQQITGLETKALKAQMNPHFVFNSLTSIQDSVVHGKTEVASKYLGKFSRLIRAILENSDKKYITLEQEIDYLRLYLELESFRFDDLDFEINVKDIPDASFIKIPAMLIQPFVENAIKHGLGHKEGSKKVTVSFAAPREDMLEVKVEDDGIGREQAAIINRARSSSHQSMGMKITAERLRLQHEQGKQEISITDCRDENGKASGTCVIIYISTEK